MSQAAAAATSDVAQVTEPRESNRLTERVNNLLSWEETSLVS